MRTKNLVVTLLLASTLLLAPATMAAPVGGNAGFGWFGSFTAFFADIVDFFRFEDRNANDLPRANGPTDPAFLQPNIEKSCGEMGSTPDPSGCV